MKKLSLIILGFIIGALATYYFCPRPDATYNGMDVTKVKAPKDTITVAAATTLSENWEKNNPTEIDSMIDVEGPRKVMRSVSWSLEDINEYLVYAKAKSDTLGYNMTGVRVYLGNYGKVKDPLKKNRNTMFIVPTGDKSISKGSMNPFPSVRLNTDIPAPPLNEGNGGQGGYPQ